MQLGLFEGAFSTVPTSMWVCVCIYIYICMCVCVFLCLGVNVCVRVCASISICIHTSHIQERPMQYVSVGEASSSLVL